jgi:hypothetical protein
MFLTFGKGSGKRMSLNTVKSKVDRRERGGIG